MVYRFYCMALFHSQARRHMIKSIKHGKVYAHISNILTYPIYSHIQYAYISNILTYPIYSHIQYTHISNILTYPINSHIQYTHISNILTYPIYSHIYSNILNIKDIIGHTQLIFNAAGHLWNNNMRTLCTTRDILVHCYAARTSLFWCSRMLLCFSNFSLFRIFLKGYTFTDLAKMLLRFQPFCFL